jgi:flagellar biosynthesis protein FliR
MPMTEWNQEELLTFFAVLVRYSTLVAILPFIGDRTVPATVKILFSLILSIALFPILLKTGRVSVAETQVWSATTYGIASVIAIEAFCGITIGFISKMMFDFIEIGGDLVGQFIGFGAANSFDPEQESQTQLVAKIHTTIGMLLFLAVDGHHLMLQAALQSYDWIGMGRLNLGPTFLQTMIDLSSQMIRLGIQLAAPFAVCMFAVTVFYGVVSRAMPELNVLVLSFSMSGFIGLCILFVSLPEFHSVVGEKFYQFEGNLVKVIQILGK